VTATQLAKPDERAEIRRSRMAALEETTRRLRGKALDVIRQKVLVCGNLFSWGPHGAAFAAGEDPAALWPAVAEALHRIRVADRTLGKAEYVLIKDWPCDEAASTAALRRFGYRPLQTDPNMVLDITPEWTSYADYLAGMNKKYRKAAAQVGKDVERAGFRVESLVDLEPHAERLYELYKQVESRADVRLAALTSQCLPLLAARLGSERFRCAAVRRGDEIAGFVTMIRDHETLVGYYLGLDYAANAEAPIYFRLLHAVVGEAIALGCRRVSFGRTALEAKARLGAKPVPVQVWIRHRVPVLNAIVQPLLKVVPHEEAPERNPFKESVDTKS
jgi:hypothetical protein